MEGGKGGVGKERVGVSGNFEPKWPQERNRLKQTDYTTLPTAVQPRTVHVCILLITNTNHNNHTNQNNDNMSGCRTFARKR